MLIMMAKSLMVKGRMMMTTTMIYDDDYYDDDDDLNYDDNVVVWRCMYVCMYLGFYRAHIYEKRNAVNIAVSKGLKQVRFIKLQE